MSDRNWTSEQSELFEMGSGGRPVLARVAVAADAGAGKTSVLVERVRRLSSEKRILCVSFTERSKADLEQRLADFLHVEVYTIHGFCGRIVSEFGAMIGLSPLLRILDQDEADDLFHRTFEKVYRRSPPSNSEHGLATFFELCRRAHERDARLEGQDELQCFIDQVRQDFDSQKRSLRALEYSDLEAFASRLLSLPEVVSTLRQRYGHVFVDEFQDTSHVQCALVRALAGKDSSLFVVGDAKQSIYRFRGADVQVFEQFTRELPAQRRLSANFRSHAEVIDAINRVCEPIIEGYQPMRAERVERERELAWKALPRVARITCEADADGIEAALLKLRAQGRDWSEVVLLLRRIRGNEELFLALERRGIGIAVTSSSSASSNESLGKLLNLWIWACEPWQKLRAAQVVVDFSDAPDQGALRSQLREQVEGLRSPFASRKTAAEVLSCEQLLEALSEQFFLERRFGAVFEQFRLFILRHQSEGLLPSALARRFDHLLLNGQDISGFALLPPPSNIAGTIRVLTVHSSKGLEFPVVLLADVKKRRSRSSAVILKGQTLWLLPRDEDGALDKSAPDVQEALIDEEAQETAESARLLYVAMTRAQEALYVLDRPEPPVAEAEEKPKRPAAKKPDMSWAAWLKAGIRNTVSADVWLKEVEPLEKSAVSHAEEPSAAKLEAEAPLYTRARVGVTELAAKLSSDQVVERAEVAQSFDGPRSAFDARDVGTEIHRYFETEDWDGLTKAASRFKLNLSSFIRWLDSEDGRMLFDGAVRTYREFAFEWKTEHGIVTGRLDRLAVFEDQAWVVDYKILRHARSKGDLLASYASQLRLYSEAVGALTGLKKVRAFVLDVTAATGQVWIEIP